jgi:hypothetical protein
MIVVIRVLGNMDRYFGGSKFTIKLQEGATYRDLLDSVALRWGEVLPQHIWDKDEKRFKPGVFCSDGQNDFTNEQTILLDKQEIIVTLPFAGG